MLFVDYAGARAADSQLAPTEQRVIGATPSRLSAITYGNVTIRMTPVRRWLHMPRTPTAYHLGDLDNEQAAAHLRDALTLADPDVDFSQVDVVYLAAAPDTPDVPASQASPNYVGDGITVDGNEIRASVNIDPNFAPEELTVEHETLHLFGLPDLYSTGDDRDAYTGGYDLMGGSATQPEPLAWQRWQIGHLPDDRVACLAAGQERELLLQPLTSDRPGTTTFVVRTGEHTRLAGEYRDRGGLDTKACSTGLLLYKIDDRIDGAAGPIRVVDARPGTGCGDHPLNDAPFDLSRPRYLDPAGFGVEVLSIDDTGLRLRITAEEVAPAPGVTVSPATISAGKPVTARWTGRPGQVVEVLSRTQPATAFSVIRTITLDASGQATTTHLPQRNTRLTGRTASTSVTGAAPLISVRSVASMRVEGDGDGRQIVTGKVYPARPGRVVSVYRNGKLYVQGRNDASGVYRIATRLPAGDVTLQVRTGDDTYNLGASSEAVDYEIA